MKTGKKSKERLSLLDERKETREKIGRRIRQLREATKLSQEKFANEFSLDRSQVSRIERGVANVEINTLVEYWRALNVTMQDFFAGIE